MQLPPPDPHQNPEHHDGPNIKGFGVYNNKMIAVAIACLLVFVYASLKYILLLSFGHRVQLARRRVLDGDYDITRGIFYDMKKLHMGGEKAFSDSARSARREAERVVLYRVQNEELRIVDDPAEDAVEMVDIRVEGRVGGGPGVNPEVPVAV